MNPQKLSQWSVCLVAGFALATSAIAAPDKRGPGKGIGKGKGGIFKPIESEVKNMFQALVAIQQGKMQVAKKELRQAVRSVPHSPAAPVIKGLLRQSLADSNNYSLNHKDKVVLIVDQVSTALTLATTQKAKEWNNKSEMRAAVHYLRIAKLVIRKGFEGKAISSMIQSKAELLEFQRAPAIRKAMTLITKAKNRVEKGFTGPGVQQLLKTAMETIVNSRVFNK